MMIDSMTVSAHPEALRTMTPFVTSLRVRRLCRFNYLVTFGFVYHCTVTVRLTGPDNEWLVFFNTGHLLSYLGRNGLHQMAVAYD